MVTKILIVFTLILLVLTSGCGGGGGKTNPSNPTTKAAVNLIINIPPLLLSQAPVSAQNKTGTAVNASTIGAGGIGKLKITVSGEGMSETAETFDYQPSASFGKQLYVVVGLNRTFKVDALTDDGATVVLTGSAVANVAKDQPNSVTISLEPPKTGVDVGAIIHEITGPPKIRFTTVPAYGSYDNVVGAVDNCAPKDCKVIVMIQAWIGWWVKPYNTSPYTTVRPDGTWECDYTTGGIDNTAGEIRAYLVTTDYVYSGMPDTADSKVLDMVSVTRSP